MFRLMALDAFWSNDLKRWTTKPSDGVLKSGRRLIQTPSSNRRYFDLNFVMAMECEVSINRPHYSKLNDTNIDGIISKNQIHPTSLVLLSNTMT